MEQGPDVGAVVVRGGTRGDFVVVLEQDATADAQKEFADIPTYARPEVELLREMAGCPEAVNAIALIKRELRFPGDEPRLIRADPRWEGNMMRGRLE